MGKRVALLDTVAREFKKNRKAIVDTLKENGWDISDAPNTPITPEQRTFLYERFRKTETTDHNYERGIIKFGISEAIDKAISEMCEGITLNIPLFSNSPKKIIEIKSEPKPDALSRFWELLRLSVSDKSFRSLFFENKTDKSVKINNVTAELRKESFRFYINKEGKISQIDLIFEEGLSFINLLIDKFYQNVQLQTEDSVYELTNSLSAPVLTKMEVANSIPDIKAKEIGDFLQKKYSIDNSTPSVRLSAFSISELSIVDYRILNNIILSFNSNNSILIGANGSGKSSLLEFVANVFASLYLQWLTHKQIIDFPLSDFNLRYHIVRGLNNFNISIMCRNGKIELFNSNHKVPLKDLWFYLPSQIVINYAGITDRLKTLVCHFETIYVDAIRNNDKNHSLKPFSLPSNVFYYSRNEYMGFIYLALLFSKNEEAKIILDKIGGDINGCAIKFHKGPKYEKYSKDFQGQVAPVFFDTLLAYDNNFELTGTLQVTDMFREFKSDISPKEVFDVLYYLYHNELLSSVDILWGDSNEFSLETISEGQKQELLTLGYTLVFNNSGTLFLLDEPDTFLHPKWQREFISSLTKATANGSCAIVTTHSPLMLGNAEKADVHILENGKLQENTPKYYGKDINSILYNLMGVEKRVSDIENKLNQLSIYLEEEDIENSQKLYDALLLVLGDNDPDIMEAGILLDNLKEEVTYEMDSEE